MLLHSSFQLLLCLSHACFSCVVPFHFADCNWFSGHVVVATGTSLSSVQLQGGASESLEIRLTVNFLDKSPWKISPRLVNLWQDMETLNHWGLNLSLMVLMIEWTGSDQMLEHPKQKHAVLFLFRSLLELSLLACLRALASPLSCSGSVLWSLEMVWADHVQWHVLVWIAVDFVTCSMENKNKNVNHNMQSSTSSKNKFFPI